VSVNFFDIIYDSKEQRENTICTKPKEICAPTPLFEVHVGEIQFVVSFYNCDEHSEMMFVLPL
jgi:hypothetical protein